MTLELIAFVAAILFGILWYWKESTGNKTYRFLNKLLNSEELQMKANDRTGFIYKQKFLLRLVFISMFFLGVMLVAKFLIPINYATISLFSSIIVGTLLGSYLADIVFKSKNLVDRNTDVVEDRLNETIDKGKDFIEDVLGKDQADKKESLKEEKPKVQEKSARDRLKEKGFL